MRVKRLMPTVVSSATNTITSVIIIIVAIACVRACVEQGGPGISDVVVCSMEVMERRTRNVRCAQARCHLRVL